MVVSNDSHVTPGFNPSVRLDHFSQDEYAILDRLSKDWYVTNGGAQFSLGPKSTYRYALVKPIDIFQEMFNISKCKKYKIFS